MPTLLYACGTRSLLLKEEQRMMVLRKRLEVTGSKREVVTGHWRKQHNEEPYDPHSSPNNVRDIKLKIMRRTERVTRTGKERGVRGFGEETRKKETTWNTQA